MTTQNDAEFNGFVKVNPKMFRGGLPLDAGMVRDATVNNLESLYNVHFQVRVNDFTPMNISMDGEITGARRLVHTFGPFPLTILKDGDSAPLYVQIAGESIGGDSNMLVALRMHNESIGVAGTSGPETSFATLKESDLGWRTVQATDGLIYIPRDRIRSYPGLSTRLNPTEPHSVTPEIVLACIDLFAQKAAAVDTVNYAGCIAKEVAFHP